MFFKLAIINKQNKVINDELENEIFVLTRPFSRAEPFAMLIGKLGIVPAMWQWSKVKWLGPAKHLLRALLTNMQTIRWWNVHYQDILLSRRDVFGTDESRGLAFGLKVNLLKHQLVALLTWVLNRKEQQRNTFLLHLSFRTTATADFIMSKNILPLNFVRRNTRPND